MPLLSFKDSDDFRAHSNESDRHQRRNRQRKRRQTETRLQVEVVGSRRRLRLARRVRTVNAKLDPGVNVIKHSTIVDFTTLQASGTN